ncbi:MAG: metal ABC transporter substrate-binding protein [Candidatus Poribacteria bacterium]|nr:metal ABC transporter substrate-binding protein [Candidatus Poribacteria bacterium]
MRRAIVALWTVSAFFLCDSACALRIVATTPDLAAVAKEIAGEDVDVHAIVKGTQDPHYVEAKPSYIRRVNRADILIYTGMELEVGWLPLLIEGARNRHMTPGSRRLINASEAVKEKLEVPEEELQRSDGDIHAEGNPHYMLDPRNGILVAELLAERFSEIDPERKEQYEANLKAFQTAYKERIKDWEERLKAWKGVKIVAYHRTWAYASNWLGFEVIGHVEEKPGIPPGPRHLANLIAQIRSEKAVAVVASSHFSPKIPQATASRAGVKYIPLPQTVGAYKEVKTYADMFEKIAVELEKAMSP